MAKKISKKSKKKTAKRLTQSKSEDITGTRLAELCNISLVHVGRLAKQGVLTKKGNGRYSLSAVTEFVNYLTAKAEGKDNDYSVLLEAEKYREKKRQNDLEEQLVAPVEDLQSGLERTVAVMVPILEGLPLLVKRYWPEVTGDQIQLVKKAVAECRNALADAEIEKR